MYHNGMRTTVHLDDDAYQAAVQHARMRGLGLGKALSELVRRGARARIPTKTVDGLSVFDPPEDLPVITPEQVKRFLDEA